MTSACRARCSCFRTEAQLGGLGQGRQGAAGRRHSLRGARPRGLHPVEPGAEAHARDKIVGGLLTPLDETGDCFKFTNALAVQKAAALGVTFNYGSIIRGLDVEGGRVRGVVTANGTLEADAVVVALGSFSPLLVRRTGIACRSIRSRAIR
jgi:D-amino-acid dehydrogenase